MPLFDPISYAACIIAATGCVCQVSPGKWERLDRTQCGQSEGVPRTPGRHIVSIDPSRPEVDGDVLASMLRGKVVPAPWVLHGDPASADSTVRPGQGYGAAGPMVKAR